MQKVFINQGITILPKILKYLSIKKIFLVVGNNGYKSIKNLINLNTINISIETFIINESNYKTVIFGCEKLKKSNSDLIIAIGGGRIIDAAKLISATALSEENYQNVITGKEIIKNKFLPLLVMPTTAGTGSEATSFSVIFLGKKKFSVASKNLLPEYVIADTKLVQEMPNYLKTCTLFDAFSQAIESFWSVNATDISRKYARKAIELINMNLERYLNHESKNTNNMVEAAYYSGKAINISKTTLPHALSYFLTINYNIPHGHAVALTLGFIGKINYTFGCDNLKKVMNDICLMLNINIKNFEKYWYDLMKLGCLETKLSNLGVKMEDLELIIDEVNVERLKNHPLNINKEIILKELKKIF